MRWNILSGRTARAIGSCFVLSLVTVPWGQPAWAEPTPMELAKAREAFRQGVQLEAANDWVGALGKFETVASVRMTPAVRFHIARCQQHLGKLLEAQGGYRLAAYEAQNSKDPKAPEVQQEASEALAELDKKIPKLIIKRGKGAETATINVDGVTLGEASIGKEFPVNPGSHTIEFKDPDGNLNKQVATLGEGETKTVDLEAEIKAPPPKPTASESAAPPPPPPPPQEGGSNLVPWIVVGAGGASLLASGVFYMMRSSAISDLDAACKDSRCPASLEDTGNKGKTYTTLGNITLGLGLVGVGVGTYLLIANGGKTAPSEPAKTESARSRPRMTVVFGGSSKSAEASLVGTF